MGIARFRGGPARDWFATEKRWASANIAGVISTPLELEFSDYGKWVKSISGTGAAVTWVPGPGVIRLDCGTAAGYAIARSSSDGVGTPYDVSNLRTVPWALSIAMRMNTAPNATTRLIMGLIATKYCGFSIQGSVNTGKWYCGSFSAAYANSVVQPSSVAPGTAAGMLLFRMRNDTSTVWASVNGEPEINCCASTDLDASAGRFYLLNYASGGTTSDQVDIDKLAMTVGE